MSQSSVAPQGASLATRSRIPSWFGILQVGTLALLAVAVALRLWPLTGHATNYDEGVYWQSLRAMASGHPLFSEVFSSQPPFFLLSMYPFYALLGQSLPAARFGIAVFSVVGILAMYALGRALGGHWTGMLAALLLALDPVYLQQSHTLEAEVPAVALEIISVAFAAAAACRDGKIRRIFAALAGIALGLGLMAKLFDVVVLVPIVLYLGQPVLGAWQSRNEPEHQGESLRAAMRPVLLDLALVVAGAIVACAVVLLSYMSSWSALYDQVIQFHLVAEHTSNRGLRYNIELLLHDGWQVPLALLALAATLLAVRLRQLAIVPPLTWLLVSAVLLIKQQPLFDHHFALLSPALALTGALILPLTRQAANHGRFASGLGRRSAIWGAATLAAVVLLASLALAGREARSAAQPVSMREAQIASTLRAASLPGDYVVSDDQYLAGLAGRDVPPELVDTSQVRIAAGYLTATQLEGVIERDHVNVILFASGRFDLVPGFRVWVQRNYSPIARFGNGAVLFMRESSAPVPA